MSINISDLRRSSSVAQVTVYLKETTPEAFADCNDAYAPFFPQRPDHNPPARMCMGGVTLALGALVEIEAIAVLPAKSAAA